MANRDVERVEKQNNTNNYFYDESSIDTLWTSWLVIREWDTIELGENGSDGGKKIEGK
ncbi:hypothetical protein YC2023_109460 [Brassica napus]